MSEQISDLGYLALKKETTKGTAVTPTVYLPIYAESITEDMAVQDIDPIMGLKAMRFDTMRGFRSYRGAIEFLGEPNVAGYVLDMLLTKGTTTGAGPYTHPFTLSPTTDPKSYTVDIARGRMVFRYYGLEASEIVPQFDENRMRLVTQVSALGVLGPRRIASVASLVLTLDTDWSASPTTGFVNSDLVRIFKADGTVVDTTVTSFTGTTVTVGSATGVATGDFICLRPATSSFTLVDFFQFGKTEFRFGASASAALSATHTAVEKGSDWKIMHHFLPEQGMQRSGSLDPVSLVRGRGDIEAKSKIFFDTPDEKNRFHAQLARSLVVRHYAGSTNQYELRVTLNDMVINGDPVNIKVGEVLFNEIAWKSAYNTSDGQMFDVKVINNVSTI